MFNFKRPLWALFLSLSLAFALAICTLTSANAVEIKADLGITHYTAAPCGNWYQCQPDTPYTLRLNALSGSFGLYTDRAHDGWQFGVGIGNGGRVTSDAMIHDVDNCNANCGPISHMQGQGTDPFAFIDTRKYWGDWFLGAELYLSRMNYENTNYDWYGGQNYATGPLVSHIDHQVKSTWGFGLSAGYQWSQTISAVMKILPTAANNSQPDVLAPGGSTWYRPVNSSSIGISPFFGAEYSF